LARLSIAADNQFPAALTAVLHWLQPIEHADIVIDQLQRSGLSRRFPEPVLRLLNAIVDDQPWAPQELVQCLTAITDADPALAEDQRYQRLVIYSRRRGIWS
jgi:hypothetical protein